MSFHLPLNPEFADSKTYVEALLKFATSSELFQRLCGGVHILDFLTMEPDLYTTVLPEEWRKWFYHHEISTILDFLMRKDITQTKLAKTFNRENDETNTVQMCADPHDHEHDPPPLSLVEYVQAIRKHSLRRTLDPSDEIYKTSNLNNSIALSRNVSVGMKPKKKHEVESFKIYIENLISKISKFHSEEITHIVDFGSGQNYLGRALASNPHNKNVIAIEGKAHNIVGAKSMDVTAKLRKKEIFIRNKKEFRQGTAKESILKPAEPNFGSLTNGKVSTAKAGNKLSESFISPTGSIRYVQLMMESGDLSNITCQLPGNSSLMVISLHSCGNLVHHGLRSLILNPSVKAVAMVGCCYNLLTERLGPPTHKVANMRSSNMRLDRTSCASDPNGFPMSERLAKFEHGDDKGIRFNITARMMAVQAPQNWTDPDCESFFTRHFYRALLQRIFQDRGLVQKPNINVGMAKENPTDCLDEGDPILIGSLRKAYYESFGSYVRGAIAKIGSQNERGRQISSIMNCMTNEEILDYESKYKSKKKELSIIWSLMAFSAGVVESIIVVDRWLYLTEQPQVKDCWVQAVFDYKQSPRNLVIVGIKK